MSKRVKPVSGAGACSPPKKAKSAGAAAGPRIAPNGYRLVDPLPVGEILTDNTKVQWIIGQSIGCGGFGEIYAAKPVNERTDHYNYVVKVDHQNGPLYAEMYFYHRVAKEEAIRKHMRDYKLDFLGMPRYIASGIHERPAAAPAAKAKGKNAAAAAAQTAKYRFLVMQRFGDDLQKKLEQVNHTFDLKTTFTISKKVIDILQYIHSFGYIHADIKASNLLLGRSYAPTPKGKGLAEQNGVHSEVWLVDFGLVEKFRNSEGQHRSCEEDQRRANNGTVEFTSRDSHIGALCRRSDLEILGFNMLSWLSGGRLPWMSNLKDHRFVHSCKKYYMDRLHDLFNFAFGKDVSAVPDSIIVLDTPLTGKKTVFDKSKLTAKVPAGIVEYFQYIVNLEFAEEPDYGLLKDMLSQAITKVKGASLDDGRFFFTKLPARTVAKITSRLKRSSLSSPEMGRRKLRASDHEQSDDESSDDSENKRRPAGRRGRKHAVIVDPEENPVAKSSKVTRCDSEYRSNIFAASLSLPNLPLPPRLTLRPKRRRNQDSRPPVAWTSRRRRCWKSCND